MFRECVTGSNQMITIHHTHKDYCHALQIETIMTSIINVVVRLTFTQLCSSTPCEFKFLQQHEKPP